jgi:hypothetical protein
MFEKALSIGAKNTQRIFDFAAKDYFSFCIFTINSLMSAPDTHFNRGCFGRQMHEALTAQAQKFKCLKTKTKTKLEKKC